MIDWNSPETYFQINPRHPHIDELIKKLQDVQLPGHVWVATSGSTGQFKWVALSKEALLQSAQAVNSFLDVTSRDSWIHPLPDFHVGGISIWARSYLSGCKVIPQTWDPVQFASTPGTLASLVPAQVHDLVRLQLSPLPTLRAVIVGGGVLSQALYDLAVQLGWPLLPSYGMTECSSQIATAKRGSPQLLLLPHVRCQIKDHKLWVKSPSLLTGYFTDHFYDPKEEGWYATSDRALLDQNTIQLLGRVDDLIKIGGELVDLSRLQKIVEELSHDSYVRAAKDDRLENIIELVTTNPQFDLQTFNQKVLPFEKIRKIQLVSEIPKSPLGKILKYGA